MQLTQAVHKNLRERPHDVCIVDENLRVTHAEFAHDVARFAAMLQSAGLQEGDRVAILSLNSVRFVECFYGTWWAGGVTSPLNTNATPREIAYALDDCDSQLLLVDDSFLPLATAVRELSQSLETVIHIGRGETPAGMLQARTVIASAEPVVDAARRGEHLAAVMYTPGTTGRPKGVMLSHSNLGIGALANLAALPREGIRTAMIAAPMFHILGCASMLCGMLQGTALVTVPRFDESGILAAVQKHGVQELMMMARLFRRLVDHPAFGDFELASLRLVMYGGGPLEAALIDRATRAMPEAGFAQLYGLTELSSAAAMLAPALHRPGSERDRLLPSAGRPMPMAEIRIVDANGHEAPAGAVGEICVRGPTVMRGYWNHLEQTDAATRRGWLHTGDAGRIDADGTLFVVDRLRDLIITDGQTVYSGEVENTIAQMPGVAACAVIGVPDDRHGERVHAIVVLHPGGESTDACVMAHCRTMLDDVKCPGSVEFRSELPISAAGKLQKNLLREPFWSGRERRGS